MEKAEKLFRDDTAISVRRKLALTGTRITPKMEHAITIGDLVKWVLIGGGVAAVVGIALYFLAAFGRGMSQ
jgi:hypothetical protein